MTHTSTEQPEALHLATGQSGGKSEWADTLHAAAAELRRQHARITELEDVADMAIKRIAELAEETEAAENWRRLALQFDNHRMQAIGHLKAVTNPSACFDKYKAAKAFLNAPPLGGEEVLAQRIATLAAQTKQAAAAPAVPQGWKLVQIELLERIQESLGSFLSDQGWSQSDMDTADALGGLLAAASQPPACNQSMQPELATYSAHARNKKGIEQ